MDKNKVLELVKIESDPAFGDERERSIKDRSFYWVFITMAVCVALFGIIRVSKGENAYEMGVTLALPSAAGFLYRFVKDRKPVDLVCCLMMTAAAAVQLAAYIRHSG